MSCDADFVFTQISYEKDFILYNIDILCINNLLVKFIIIYKIMYYMIINIFIIV